MKNSMKGRIITAALSATLLFGAFSAPAALAAQSAEVKAGVNMRTAPSTSSKVIRTLKRGEDLTVIEKVNNYWYEVKDSTGKKGYVSTNDKYLSINGSSSNSGSGSSSKDTSSNDEKNSNTNGVIVASVSFREGASTSADRIRYLQKGEKVTVLSKPNSYWYHVQDSNGKKGYVSTSSKYISVSGKVAEPGSGSGSTKPDSSKDQTASERIEAVISAGMSYLGTPYEFGSDRNTTKTFDCSDFVRQAFKEGAGITMPADSRKQGEYVKDNGNVKTDWTKLKRGDVMFFMDYKGSKASSYKNVNKSTARVSHDGIYLGNGKILHTFSKAGGGVTISSIEGTHWEHRFLYGGSAL